jgi:hypothetical protein
MKSTAPVAGIPATAAAVVSGLIGTQSGHAEKLPAHTEWELFGAIDVLRCGRQCLVSAGIGAGHQTGDSYFEAILMIHFFGWLDTSSMTECTIPVTVAPHSVTLACRPPN